MKNRAASHVKQQRRPSEGTISRTLISQNRIPQFSTPIAPKCNMRLPKMSMHNLIHKRGIATFSSEMTIQISRASTLPALSKIEPVVRASSPLPPGYKFLPKGNVYMTRHCRQQTHLAHQTVY
ncbi:hypothetical protein GGS24DRAFT_456214 [Hypoxylon argillaceum]|nr:hypothetical protein GGS24DRAFT_456214 [Hypoxylon argillaceum]